MNHEKIAAVLSTIPADAEHRCRYETCGDWQNNGIVSVQVSRLCSERSERAVMLHELVEAWLCEQAGITEEQVSDFDRKFEGERSQGLHSETAEPGDDPRAPYRQQHIAATAIEMMFCTFAGLAWSEHEGAVNAPS